MKKLLIGLFLLLTITLNGQLIEGVVASAQQPIPYDADYQTYYNALDIKPGKDTANLQNNLVLDLKAAGVWATRDVIYLTAQRTRAGAELNLKDPTGDDNITDVAASSFTKYEGFTNVELNTNWNPSTEGVHYTLNSASINGYFRLNLSSTAIAMGCISGTDEIKLELRYGGFNTFYARVNSSAELSTTGTGTSLGMFTATRSNSTSVASFHNGSNKASSFARTSTAVPNANLLILNTTGGTPYVNQVSYVDAGANLTDQQVIDENTAVETYMDAIGKGVE